MIDSTGDRARGAGLSGPESANVVVAVVLCVLKVQTRSTLHISWSFEDVTMSKQSWKGPEMGPETQQLRCRVQHRAIHMKSLKVHMMVRKVFKKSHSALLLF